MKGAPITPASVLEEDRIRWSFEYCQICLLPWRELCIVVPPKTSGIRCVEDLEFDTGPYVTNRFASALDLDERRVELHESLEAAWDVDRDFIKTAIEKAESVYKRTNDIVKAYDEFMDYLKEIAELPIYERHPQLKFLKDLEEGKIDLSGISSAPNLGMPDTATEDK